MAIQNPVCIQCDQPIPWDEPLAHDHDGPLCIRCHANLQNLEWWKSNGWTPEDKPFEEFFEEVQYELPALTQPHNWVPAHLARDLYEVLHEWFSNACDIPQTVGPHPVVNVLPRSLPSFVLGQMREGWDDFYTAHLRAEVRQDERRSAESIFSIYLNNPDLYSHHLDRIKAIHAHQENPPTVA